MIVILSSFRRIASISTLRIKSFHHNTKKLHCHIKYGRYIAKRRVSCSSIRTCQLQIVHSKSFCTNIQNTGYKTRKAKLRFAAQFLYLPGFVMLYIMILNREHILTYFMQQIFQRRESFLLRCYPKRIILIRHGQSRANVDQSVHTNIPDHCIKLTELGYTQALDAGKKLKSIVCDEDIYAYYSPYKRAIETLNGILEGGDLHEQTKVQIEDVRLIEQKFGNRQNQEKIAKEMKQRLAYGRYFYQFKYGESGLDVTLRATGFTDRLFDHFRTGYYSTRPDIEWNVLIVSHGLFMRVFLKTFLRRTVEEFQTWYNYANCEICILEKSENGEYYVSSLTPLPLTQRKRVALND